MGSKAKEHEKEEEGDGDTLDSDEFCILDAPGLGIAVCVLGWEFWMLRCCTALLELLSGRSSLGCWLEGANGAVQRRHSVLHRDRRREEGRAV